MHKLLFVPQIERNSKLLLSYAEGLGNSVQIFLLRNNLFGSNSDIKSNWSSSKISSQFLEPDFLLLSEPNISEHNRLFVLRKLHNRFKDFLKKNGFDLIILGADSVGMGHWTAIVAKELGIKTIVLQEGCRYIFKMHTPLISRIKRLTYKCAAFLIYKPAMYRLWTHEYQTADYAFVWGQYEKDCAIKKGKNKKDVFVIGDPRIKERPIVKTINNKLKILFLDISVSTLLKGTVDENAFLSFNKSLVEQASVMDCSFYYKPHPFVKQYELDYLTAILKNKDNIQLITNKTSEECFDQFDACITYPSTAMYGVLAAGVPLILITFKARGFSSLLWDPIKLYRVGLYINNAQELKKIIETISQDVWYNKYRYLSKLAAEQLVGPLDGKAPERFVAKIGSILEGTTSI
jgi:hypothetical protein